MQLGQTARDQNDMGLGRVERPHAEIAGQPDAIDDMPSVASRGKQMRQGCARHRVHAESEACQPGGDRRADEAAGAKNGK